MQKAPHAQADTTDESKIDTRGPLRRTPDDLMPPTVRKRHEEIRHFERTQGDFALGHFASYPETITTMQFP